ncbi:MAG: hypothetical protein FD180_3189 [Planctomycetota bacterium]|nr:MAG: hypothetical protein FD180_3189 [Planctomycetota bacterium]
MGLAEEWIASMEDPERVRKELRAILERQIAKENGSATPGRLDLIEVLLMVYDDEPRDDDDLSVDAERDAKDIHRLLMQETAALGLGDFKGRIRIESQYFHERRPVPNGRQIVINCGFFIPFS